MAIHGHVSNINQALKKLVVLCFEKRFIDNTLMGSKRRIPKIMPISTYIVVQYSGTSRRSDSGYTAGTMTNR